MKRLWVFYKKREKGINLTLAIFGLSWGFYSYFFPRSTQNKLGFFIEQKSDVITINKEIKGLQILYTNNNIAKQKLNLRILKISLVNYGETDITAESYDNSTDFGLNVKNGIVLSANLLEPKNSYLKEKFHLIIEDSARINMSKAIIESGKRIDIEVLILHKQDLAPQISGIGKIVGQDEILVRNKPYTSKTDEWLELGTEIITIIAAFALFAAAIFALVGIISLISTIIEKRKRKKLLKLLGYPYHPLSNDQKKLISIFASLNNSDMKYFINLFTNQSSVEEAYEKEIEEKNKVATVIDLISIEKVVIKDKKIEFSSLLLDIIDELSDHQLASTEENKIKMKSIVAETSEKLKKQLFD